MTHPTHTEIADYLAEALHWVPEDRPKLRLKFKERAAEVRAMPDPGELLAALTAALAVGQIVGESKQVCATVIAKWGKP